MGSFLKHSLAFLSLAGLSFALTGCPEKAANNGKAPETKPAAPAKTPAVGSTTGPGAEVPEPAPKADAKPAEDSPAEKPADEKPAAEKSDEKPAEKKAE